VGTISYQRSECFTEYWSRNTIEVCAEICRGVGKKGNKKKLPRRKEARKIHKESDQKKKKKKNKKKKKR